MKVFLILIIPFLFISSFGQKTSSELFLDLKKLASLKRVLYIAAHPDDENTRALAWLSLGEEAQTAYLSLTRGDGGQNLIGKELGADLGILRSQELLAARSIDNAQQFFSRAVDFGYSKSAEESFKKWQKEEVLADVVRVIRKFEPDVIITRFPPDDRAGHGHHTASALLAIEAAELANDKSYLKEEIGVQGNTWETGSVYWNSSYWWDKDIAEKTKDDPNYLQFDIGEYNSALGKSYNEIGTLARSQHKCQGFGSIIERGERIEYFQYLSGTKLKSNLFENSTRTWTQLVSEELDMEMKALIDNFNFKDASKNVPALLSIYKKLNKLENIVLRDEKRKQCQELITNCLGLNIELIAENYAVSISSEVDVILSIINRSKEQVKLESVIINNKSQSIVNAELSPNIVIENSFKIKASDQVSNPYWLQKPYENLFSVLDVSEIGKPNSLASISGKVKLKIGEETFEYDVTGEHKWSDPSYGERRREIVFTPMYAVSLDENSILAKSGVSKSVQLKVKSFESNIHEKMTIKSPAGWTITPNTIQLDFDNKFQEKSYDIKVTPSSAAKSESLVFLDKSLKPVQLIHEINYDHISSQMFFSDAKINLVKINAEIVAGKIGYIKGVEDKLPMAIEQLGFEVKVIEVEDISKTDLSQFKSIVIGIRAYNVKPELMNFKPSLMTYVENGGNLIVQYNTASKEVKEMDLGPYPFEISRDRVTEEDAPPTFLMQAHELLNKPNKITNKDFENWVQERGLYFAGNWDEKYQTIISWGDTGQDQVEGGLIVAKYGKGNYIYTGISFFRELPSGVEGAYRLFANLLSYGRN